MSLVLIFTAVFLSRVLFLSISPSFFDSLEYLGAMEQTPLFQALKTVHAPAHPAFIVFSWFFNKLPFDDALFKTELLQAFWGFGAVIVFYLIVKKVAGARKAVLLSLILAFLPYIWLSSVNLVYEPQLVFFLLLSLLSGQTNKYFLAGLFWGLAFLVSPVALFSLPLTGLYLFQHKRKNFKPFIVWTAIFLLGAILIYKQVAGLKGEGVINLLTSGADLGEKMRVEGGLFFARAVRNSLVVYFYYLTVPLGIILLILALTEFRRNKKMRVVMVFWLGEFLYLNSVWHLGMYGRISLILTVCPVFLLLKTRDIWLKLIIVFLVFSSAHLVIPYRFRKTPYVLEKEYFYSLTEKPSIIISSYEEPYLKEILIDFRVLNSPRTDQEEIKTWIKKAQLEKGTVFITQQAVTTPYWQYDGMNFHLLSKRKKYSQTAGQQLMENLELKVFQLPYR